MVEFLLRSGDLSVGQKASAVDMAIGSAVHRRLQKKAKEADSEYQTEVRLSIEEEFPSFVFLLKGNADGIGQTPEGRIQVDEIKTISVPASLVPQSERILHWAQLKLYGHMLCVQQQLDSVQLCLIYLEYDTDIITKDCRIFSAEELQKFYHQLTNDYARWIHWQIEHQRDYRAARLRTALSFPRIPTRSTQRGRSSLPRHTRRTRPVSYRTDWNRKNHGHFISCCESPWGKVGG